MFQGMPCNDLFEEVEQLITNSVMWEVCDRGVSRPRDYGSDEDTD
jgi:hypothetical protein